MKSKGQPNSFTPMRVKVPDNLSYDFMKDMLDEDEKKVSDSHSSFN